MKRSAALLFVLLTTSIFSIEIPFEIVKQEDLQQEEDDFLVDVKLTSPFRQDQKVVNVIIGSNEEEFRVLIDTGSTELWVHSTDCRRCLSHQKKFNKLASSSFIDKRVKREILTTGERVFQEMVLVL